MTKMVVQVEAPKPLILKDFGLSKPDVCNKFATSLTHVRLLCGQLAQLVIAEFAHVDVSNRSVCKTADFQTITGLLTHCITYEPGRFDIALLSLSYLRHVDCVLHRAIQTKRKQCSSYVRVILGHCEQLFQPFGKRLTFASHLARLHAALCAISPSFFGASVHARMYEVGISFLWHATHLLATNSSLHISTCATGIDWQHSVASRAGYTCALRQGDINLLLDEAPAKIMALSIDADNNSTAGQPGRKDA